MNIIGIIPARMGSSRFPGKPLAKICDEAMIYHVYWRSKMAKILKEVYIATCDKEIEDYCLNKNMNVVMTKDTHQRASDRAAEAMLTIEKSTGDKIDVVVMIQGDEPMLNPEMINLAVKPLLEDDAVDITNLMSQLKSKEEHEDPNEVKVVVDQSNYALYFSREPIPSRKKTTENIEMLKQVCIIPFRRDFLIKFNSMQQTPLEIIESIDMLRLLEKGHRVRMVYSPYETYSVDTLQDLEKVGILMSQDELTNKYHG
ncbi:MAG: 3-deoxy-manno-octulosonate cytidylyltransferase [Parcubacteria group bacterium]|nr:3-deoxy-manno-octulosonate cytidylyltransferase [Parcubacteria group bacterium]